MPIPPGTLMLCGTCSIKKPYQDHVIAGHAFEEPLRTLLHEFKYQEGLYLTSYLANLILAALPKELPPTQCLIPVPLHPLRLKQRGFNQAAELAKYLSRQLGIPYHLTHCHKVVHTKPQAELNAQSRQKNLKGAFQAEPMPYQHVTLIDDLITTGSTINEIAKTIKKQGVTQVDVWCCARVY